MGAVGGMLMLAAMQFLLPGAKEGEAYRPNYLPIFIVLGVCMAVCVALLFWKINEPKCVAEMEAESVGLEEEPEPEKNAGTGEKLKGPQLRSLLLILASVALWFMGYNAVTSGFSRYATQELNGSFSMILMVCTAAAIVSYLPVGWVAAHIGRKKTILLGVLMLGCSFAAAAFFHAVTPFLYVFFILAGMGWAFINVNSYPMVVELSSGSDVGRYTGYYYTVSMTAQIITPVFSGFLMGHVGYRTLFPYAAFFVFASFVTMLFVRHGDARPEAKKGLEAFDVDD